RLAVAHAVPVGGFTGWRQAMPVTQWSAVKPIRPVGPPPGHPVDGDRRPQRHHGHRPRLAGPRCGARRRRRDRAPGRAGGRRPARPRRPRPAPRHRRLHRP
ncbi:hypothetical protein AB0D22_36125, partial [Kitasatospora sp. NPDC048538]